MKQEIYGKASREPHTYPRLGVQCVVRNPSDVRDGGCSSLEAGDLQHPASACVSDPLPSVSQPPPSEILFLYSLQKLGLF